MVYVIYHLVMKFEYDPSKSQSNKAKHGLDFEEAQALWDDPGIVIAPAQSETEPRYLVVGRVQDVFWTAVITYRDDATRIISVRRSRKMEAMHYDKINHG